MTPEQFANRVRKLGAISKQGVPATRLLNDEFIRANTDFDSLQSMLKHCGFDTLEDFIKNLPGDDFFASHTRFASFTEMKTAAGKAFTKSAMGSDFF